MLKKNTIITLARAIALEEERRRVQKALGERIEREKMLADISRQAVAIEGANYFLRWCLKRMRQTLKVDGIFVWRYFPLTDTFNIAVERVKRGYPLQKENLQNVPARAFLWAVKRLRKNRIINCQDLENVAIDKEKNIMLKMGIKSVLVIPLFVRSAFYGAIGFESYRQKREWLENDVQILRIVSQIITRSIENLEFEKALERTNNELERRVSSRTSELQEMTGQLKIKQTELEEINKILMDTNKALLTFVHNYKRDREEMKRKLGLSLRERIMPLLEGVLEANLASLVRAELDIVYLRLQDIVRGFPEGRKFSSCFTPAEAKVAAMIKNGLRNQDIARELKVSVETVKTHRRNIRDKLKIKNEKINLRSFLEIKWNQIV